MTLKFQTPIDTASIKERMREVLPKIYSLEVTDRHVRINSAPWGFKNEVITDLLLHYQNRLDDLQAELDYANKYNSQIKDKRVIDFLAQ